jgi:hypothetical protein
MYHVGESGVGWDRGWMGQGLDGTGVGWDRGWMGQRGYPIEVIVANFKKIVSVCIIHILIRG